MNEWNTLLQDNNYVGIKQYIKKGADLNDTNESEESVLMVAIMKRCDKEIIDLLIDAGADKYDFDAEGVSIFDYSITYNNMDLFKQLIEEGIDINNTRRKSGFTALMGAVCYSRGEMFDILLKKGANTEVRDAKGFQALDFARKMNKKRMLEKLTK